jgi:hypothetical protein
MIGILGGMAGHQRHEANPVLATSTPPHTIAMTASGTSDEETPPIVTHDHKA